MTFPLFYHILEILMLVNVAQKIRKFNRLRQMTAPDACHGDMFLPDRKSGLSALRGFPAPQIPPAPGEGTQALLSPDPDEKRIDRSPLLHL